MGNKTLLRGLWFVIAAGALTGFFFPGRAFPDDLRGPDVRWDRPAEGSCWAIDAANPTLGFSVTAEDPSGVKQGTVWMKEGHHGWTSDLSSWSRVWGATFVSGVSAPPVVNQIVSIRMLGRGEGEYTLAAEFADMAHHNLGHAILHVSVDFAAPVVTITHPIEGRAVCKDMNLRVDVTVTDTGCGTSVYLYLDAVTSATPLAADASSPYQLTIPKEYFRNPTHRIIVKAVDRAGRSSTAEMTIRPILICRMVR